MELDMQNKLYSMLIEEPAKRHFAWLLVPAGIIIACIVVTTLSVASSSNHEALGTLHTQNLIVETDGQQALFSTRSAGTGAVGNIWIGGGGQSWVGSVFPSTGQNTSLGIGSLANATTGNVDVAIGFNALNVCTTCYTSTAVGVGTLSSDTTGVDNTAIGYLAAINLTTGSTNTAVGVETLSACTTCGGNVAMGISAGQFITTGTDNVAIGHASQCGTTGTLNSCFGSQSGNGIQGATADVAIGPFTLQAGTSGNANVAIGSTSLTAVTSGANNTAVGIFGLTGVTTGSENVSLGDHANGLGGNISNETAIGALALEVDTGGFNVGVGYSAGSSITTGVANTIVGYNSSTGITTGNSNTIIGSSVSGLAAGTTQKIILADGRGDLGHQIWFSASAPTSVNHGTLGTGSSNTVGNVTGIGANNSVTLTYSDSGFPNRSWCHADSNSATTPQVFIITNSATTPVFACFDMVGLSQNCQDFTYWCTGN